MAAVTRQRRWALGTLAVLGAVVVVLIVVPAMLRERLGGIAERQMNACVNGYVAHVGAVDLNLLGLSVHVRDLRVTQDAHPEAPMLRIAHVSTSLNLAPMIRGRLVAR